MAEELKLPKNNDDADLYLSPRFAHDCIINTDQHEPGAAAQCIIENLEQGVRSSIFWKNGNDLQQETINDLQQETINDLQQGIIGYYFCHNFYHQI
jgi:hypothetical protein